MPLIHFKAVNHISSLAFLYFNDIAFGQFSLDYHAVNSPDKVFRVKSEFRVKTDLVLVLLFTDRQYPGCAILYAL